MSGRQINVSNYFPHTEIITRPLNHLVTLEGPNPKLLLRDYMKLLQYVAAVA